MRERAPTVPLLLFTIIVALFALFATGCQTLREDWASVPVKREPKVDLVQYVHSVAFTPGSTKIEPQERDRLDGFLVQSRVDGTADLFLVVPRPQTNADIRRRETVVAFLNHRRLNTHAVSPDFGIEAPAADTLSVVVRRYVVTLPGCPDWSGRPGRTDNNVVTRNWGCATATNLGLMVANPADLAYGRKPGPMDGEAAVLAIQRYRAGETRPLTPEDVGTIQAQQKESSGNDGGGS
ncbi:MAG: hypothetical protein ISR47_10075 [Rhodospirillales bacterium]|nr:hypothetical protein [Rhodospirillales bacterium]